MQGFGAELGHGDDGVLGDVQGGQQTENLGADEGHIPGDNGLQRVGRGLQPGRQGGERPRP